MFDYTEPDVEWRGKKKKSQTQGLKNWTSSQIEGCESLRNFILHCYPSPMLPVRILCCQILTDNPNSRGYQQILSESLLSLSLTNSFQRIPLSNSFHFVLPILWKDRKALVFSCSFLSYSCMLFSPHTYSRSWVRFVQTTVDLLVC